MVAGDARNVDILTADAFPLVQGRVYRAVVDVGGAGGLLGATEFAIGKVIEALADRGFANVKAWTSMQYAQLPPDWPRASDPIGVGDAFPDWTLRLQGTWNAPSLTLPRRLDDVQSGTMLTVRRAWEYDAGAAPGPDVPAPDAPDAVGDLWPLMVAAGIAIAAAGAAWYVAANEPRSRRRAG